MLRLFGLPKKKKKSENEVGCVANMLSGGRVNASPMKSDQCKKQRMLEGSATCKICNHGNSVKYHSHLVCHIVQKLLFSAKKPL
jgi:hypothetical protein